MDNLPPPPSQIDPEFESGQGSKPRWLTQLQVGGAGEAWVEGGRGGSKLRWWGDEGQDAGGAGEGTWRGDWGDKA